MHVWCEVKLSKVKLKPLPCSLLIHIWLQGGGVKVSGGSSYKSSAVHSVVLVFIIKFYKVMTTTYSRLLNEQALRICEYIPQCGGEALYCVIFYTASLEGAQRHN